MTAALSVEDALVGSEAVSARWSRVRRRLRDEFGETTFTSWLDRLNVAGIEDGRLVIATPTRFFRNWVEPRYGDRIRALWQVEDPTVRSVDFVIEPGLAKVEAGDAAEMAGDFEDLPGEAVVSARGGSLTLRSGSGRGVETFASTLDARLNFDSFVVGKANEFAHATARRVAESDTVPFNPLFIYGGVGLGKTHLMHAIAWKIRELNPNRRVIYLSAEKFMYEFIRALRYRNIVAFKDMFRSVDVLMIDDVQFIAGKESTQEEFFHTFNALVDQNRQIVVSGDRSPSDMEGMAERMRSRLGWGMVAEVHPTSYELRLGILLAKKERHGAVDLPTKVLEFLAHKIASNVRELEGALNRVIAHSTLMGHPVTLESTQEVLHDVLRAQDRRITIEDIQKRVSEFYSIKVTEMKSARRAQRIVRPRQVAMFLAKLLTERSLPEIGRRFGDRDHTTVIHAVRRIEQLMQSDATLAEDVELLRRMLES